MGEPLCMYRGNAIIHLLGSLPESPVTIATPEPHCPFLDLSFVPVTLSPRYFSVPLYLRLEFIHNIYNKTQA